MDKRHRLLSPAPIFQQDATVAMLNKSRMELEAAQKTMADQEQELREV
jgi:hypothetical protein